MQDWFLSKLQTVGGFGSCRPRRDVKQYQVKVDPEKLRVDIPLAHKNAIQRGNQEVGAWWTKWRKLSMVGPQAILMVCQT